MSVRWIRTSHGSEPRRLRGRGPIHVRDRLPGQQPGEPGGVHLVVAWRVLPALCRHRDAADRTAPGGRSDPRSGLWRGSLVFAINRAGADPTPWEPSYELAEAGFRLFNYLLPSEDETARKVRRWLEDLRKQSGLISLEVVVEEQSADPRTFLSMPWNLVYDERPATYKAAFQKGRGCRAVAAVLVGPLQPDQRPASRALEAAADLERPAGRRGDRPDGLRGPARRAEAAAGRVPGRGGPDGRRLAWTS